MEAVLNNTTRQKHKVSIKDAKEIMYWVWLLEEKISNNPENMKDGIYLELMDILMNMSAGEFYIELDTIARKPERKKHMPRIKPEAMRKFAKNNPDKAVICPRCDTPLMKRSFAEHLKSNKCKDIHCIVKGTGGCIDDPEETNKKVIEIYEKNEPLPEVELNAENYYHHNLFNGE